MITSLRSRLVRCFLAGVFAVLPLIITIAAVAWVTELLHSYLGPETMVGGLLSRLGVQVAQGGDPGWLTYLFGWVIVLGAVFLLGVFLEFGAKQFVSNIMNWTLEKIPAVGSIYRTSKQVVDLLDRKDSADIKGMSPVYCRFGNDGTTLILALLVSSETFVVEGENYHIVIIPTAPVPFGGGLVFVPTRNVTEANIPVDALMSIYVSMGATAPEFLARPSDAASKTEAVAPGEVEEPEIHEAQEKETGDE